jgi:hypothetical protein
MIQRVTKYPNRLEVLLETGEVKGISSFYGELLGWNSETYAIRIGNTAQVYEGSGSRRHDLQIPSGWSNIHWDGRYFTYVVDNKYQYTCTPSGAVVNGPVEI